MQNGSVALGAIGAEAHKLLRSDLARVAWKWNTLDWEEPCDQDIEWGISWPELYLCQST